MLTKDFNGLTYKFLPYNELVQVYQKNISVPINEYCNGFTVVNMGNTTVTINNKWILYPGTPGTNNGEGKSVGGNFLELYKGELDIAFGVGNDPRVIVSQKIYLMNFND